MLPMNGLRGGNLNVSALKVIVCSISSKNPPTPESFKRVIVQLKWDTIVELAGLRLLSPVGWTPDMRSTFGVYDKSELETWN